jgi:hypothetical protein
MEVNLDRFSRPMSWEKEHRVVARCSYCETEFYEGDSVLEYDGEYYCDNICLKEGIGARWTTLEYLN